MSVNIHWFRKDLRVSDNAAFSTSASNGTVIPIYIIDPEQMSQMGAANKVWLHASLGQLNASLDGNLLILDGAPQDILPRLVAHHGVSQVSWTRRYDPYGIEVDQALKASLEASGTTVVSMNGSLLWEPWDVQKPDGTHYRVFTPFYKRGCAAAPLPHLPVNKPTLQIAQRSDEDSSDPSLLIPKNAWYKNVLTGWQPGEKGASAALQKIVNRTLAGYKEGRDYPAQKATSRLSPHLHFGEISPNQIWHAVTQLSQSQDTAHFKSELAWREFSYHLLYRHPDLNTRNLNPKFDPFPWRDAPEDLLRWQKGQTGIPIVDAGMRELWQTGYMHNRVRMIVASFLTKNLLIHWQHGLAWFNDTLFDADPANNAASWQWVAGSGADAAPYFRIFNPVTQSKKFDADGDYIKTYIPELAHMIAQYIHAPWEAPGGVQNSLVGYYPPPIVDLKDSRNRALTAYSQLA